MRCMVYVSVCVSMRMYCIVDLNIFGMAFLFCSLQLAPEVRASETRVYKPRELQSRLHKLQPASASDSVQIS